MSKDQLASEVSSPANQARLNYSDLVEDEIWLSDFDSRTLRNRPANYSDSEWQDHLDHLNAIDVAKQEWVNYQARLRDATGST